MDLIPSSAPHWHLLLNHFPSIGTVIATGLLLCTFFRKSEDLTRAALVLFVLMALITIPTYVSGAAARGAIIRNPGISTDLIAAHQEAATLAFISLVVTGWLSWFALWQHRRFSRPYGWIVPAILALGVVTLGLMVKTGSLGGDINHAEIRLGGELAAAAGQVGPSAALAAWIMNSAWAWPALEAGHFMGMAVLFGVVLLVALRVLGLVRSVPFTAFHRLLPLGAFGFMLNVVTGMLFFIADYERYITMTNSFFPKIALIAIGGVAVLYFTIFDKPWALKAGDDAPLATKVVAAATVLMWSGVIIYGRLLPYLEGAGG
jgi:uncharacterized membrane protein